MHTGFMATDDMAGTRGKPPGVAGVKSPEDDLYCPDCAVENDVLPEAGINDPERQPDGVRIVLRHQYSGPSQIKPGRACTACERVIQVTEVTSVSGLKDEYRP